MKYKVLKTIYKFTKPPHGVFDQDFLDQNMQLLASEGDIVTYIGKAGKKSSLVKTEKGTTLQISSKILSPV